MAVKRSNGRSAHRSSVVVVWMTGREVRVLQAARRDLELVVQHWGSAPAGDEASRARAVAGALAKAGIREKRVVVCLPARSVVVRQVQLPPAGKEQLPQLVQYEAQRHLPLPVDQLAAGYQVLQRDGKAGEPGTPVLMGIARRPDLMRLEKALAAEGISVEGYGIDALSVTDAYLTVAEASLNGAARLILAPEEGGVHAQILHGPDLLHSRYLSGRNSEWTPELRRSLAAFSLERPEAALKDAVLLGEGDETEISRATGLPVRRAALSPAYSGGTDLPPDWGAVVGLARQWLGLGSFGLRIPAQGWQTTSGRSSGSWLVAALVATIAVVAGLVVWQLDRQASRRRETQGAAREARQTERDRKMLETLTKKRDRLREQAAAIAASSGRTPPLELLREVALRAPADVWLTQVTYQAGKPVQIEGTTRTPAQITIFRRSLANVPAFDYAEMGSMSSAVQDKVPVTHFSIRCGLEEGKEGADGDLAP